MKQKIIIIGGGASGFFLAANLDSDSQDVLVVEQAVRPMQKVKVSGGGRCNLTHACFDPHELVKFYPRGSKELISVFTRFQPADTIKWFENKGVRLYTDDDGCIFPSTDSSQTIIDVLLHESSKNGVKTLYNADVVDISVAGNGFLIQTDRGDYNCDIPVITTGSSRKMWSILKRLGHNIIPPVPSLFSFNCKDDLLRSLAGTTFENVEISIPNLKIRQSGILLVTHRGLSGPAVLKISAFGARFLNSLNYDFDVRINWISSNLADTVGLLKEQKALNPKKHLYSSNIELVTSNFWKNLLQKAGIGDKFWADAGNNDIAKIADILTDTHLHISGRNVLKEEFVTAGGVDLKEVDFKTMQSKLIPNLYFAGEVLDIDGLTGGFNFQACWSEAHIIAKQLTT
ncbi:MAG: NAD(P)/FAD-dependent oxidoreductase [Tannerella sp.]|jgi:predicted Rossmann fold flavoprotein|nr:NAD(P)/FAD-dependent oxidoreductase [Tannerella sp.]